ncbi:hypothetical protein OIO90_000050 [Microbotryomycetes sp. JL221]|nr:hypothetical protein OIO90_000050 [Microbotryomycetes sp. JL221]
MHPTPATLNSAMTSDSSVTNAMNGHASGNKVTLADVVDKCPSLKGKHAWYVPTSWLSSGHLATIWCTIANFDYDKVEYSREIIEVPDGGRIGIDIAPPITPSDPIDARPILVIAHGLTGGSHESYVRDVLAKITKPKDEGGMGWRGAVVNSRGCAGMKCTNNVLYNGGKTDDLRCALTFLSHFAPDAPLYGAGFSLGANQMAKLVGEDGDATPLKGAVVLGAPWDFWEGHIMLSASWLRRIYSKAMAANLRRVLKNAGDFENDKRLDWAAIYGNPEQTLYEFDSLVTAPLGGFPTAAAYYRWASATNTIENVSVPLLSISALDDPVVSSSTVPSSAAAKNPNLVFALTQHGGHLGWFENFWRPRRWISKPVLEFLKALHEVDDRKRLSGYVTEPKVDTAKRPRVGDDMVLLKGKDETVGFKLIKEEKHQVEIAGHSAINEGMTKGL